MHPWVVFATQQVDVGGGHHATAVCRSEFGEVGEPVGDQLIGTGIGWVGVGSFSNMVGDVALVVERSDVRGFGCGNGFDTEGIETG